MALINKLTAIADAIRAKTGKEDILTLDQMPLEIAGIQSGAELNFKVVGDITAPTSPSENTIWVNTENEITEWFFSANEPETPIENMVWFITGTKSNSEFNALKENSIQVYPLSAVQYISGAWVEVNTQIYQDGQWMSWILYLYKNGNTFDDLTGGFVTYGSSFTLGETGISVSCRGTSGVCRTANPIDLTNISTLYCTLTGITTSTSTTKHFAFSVWSTAPTAYTGSGDVYESYTSLGATGSDKVTLILDVSRIRGEKYIGVEGFSNGTGAKLYGTVTEIRAEYAPAEPVYIFKSGEGALVQTYSRSGRNSSITLTQDSIAFYCGSGDIGTAITTNETVALTGFSTLKARAKCTYSPNNYACFGLATTVPGDYTVSPDISHVGFNIDSVEREYSLPIPSSVESAYIGVYGMFTGDVYDIWLE